MPNTLVERNTLYDLEESLSLLLESAEENGEDPSIQQAIEEYLDATLEKRDRVAQFLGHLECQQELAKAEIRRLRDREAYFARQQDRLTNYIITLMESRGVRKLEGKTATLSLRACPPSVQILDEADVPAAFKIVKQSSVIDKKAVKAAIESGTEVPGADLRIGGNTLVIK